MSPLDKRRNDLEVAEKAFECLERALEGAGLLLPKTEQRVIESRAYANVESLPECLQNPQDVLTRGRRVEKQGLAWRSGVAAGTDPSMNEEFALAARNGGKFDEPLLAKMHAHRAAIEKKASK